MIVAQLFLILFAVLNIAVCDEESDEQKKINQEIADMICAEEDRSKNFFKCVMCCQGKNIFRRDRNLIFHSEQL